MLRMITSLLLLSIMTCSLPAACSLDHLKIGRNPDGITGTADDNRLWIDGQEKYRHAVLNQPDFARRYYRLAASWFGDYRRAEPGFDLVADPNRAVANRSGLRIVCLNISPNLTVYLGSTQKLYSQPGDSFNYGVLADPHAHLTFVAPAQPGLAARYWLRLQVLDDSGHYSPSAPLTIIFNLEPAPGDFCVDGSINAKDLTDLVCWWLSPANSRNDYAERTDSGRDGFVTLHDFQTLSQNWDRSDPNQP